MAIVVGVDGSPESKEALRWAITEASLRQTPVRAVYAWHPPVGLMPTAGPVLPLPMYQPDEIAVDEELRSRAERQLDSVVVGVLREMTDAAGLRVEQEVLAGHAAETLVQATADAELLVVGSRGRGGFAGMLLGSVSHACAQHALCPVVIVRKP